MKIAIIAPGGFDPSGKERVIPALLWLVERLARQHEVYVFTIKQFPDFKRYELLGAQIVNLGTWRNVPKFTQQPVRLKRIMEIFREADWYPEVIHAFWAGESGLLANIVARKINVPLIVSLGGGELVWLPEINYGSQGNWRRRLRVEQNVKIASAITCGSQYLKNKLIKYSEKIHLIPLGVDDNLFSTPMIHSNSSKWRLLQVASINQVKDQGTLLNAIGTVISSGFDVHLDIVGEDTLDGEIQTLASDLGLDDHVTFHGYYPIQKIIPIYQQAHLYIQSSLHESQGVAVCEAAAAGVVVLGTMVGIVAELAPNAAYGVPVSDHEQMAKGVVRLLESKELRDTLRINAQNWALTYNADWTANQFNLLYECLVHSR
jgi:glycosyltransferase involved in cell wall biosynthesis